MQETISHDVVELKLIGLCHRGRNHMEEKKSFLSYKIDSNLPDIQFIDDKAANKMVGRVKFNKKIESTQALC